MGTGRFRTTFFTVWIKNTPKGCQFAEVTVMDKRQLCLLHREQDLHGWKRSWILGSYCGLTQSLDFLIKQE